MQSRTCAVWATTWGIGIAAPSAAFAGDAAEAPVPIAASTPIEAQNTSRVVYRSVPGCPDASAFLARLSVRLPDAIVVPEGAPAAFVVTVSSSAEESTARVERIEADGENVVRRVSGKTCDEVVSAAALITALGIEARVGPNHPPRVESADMAATLPRDAAHGATPGRASEWSAGAALGVDSWSAPGGALTAGAFGELGTQAPFRYLRLGLRGATGSTAIEQRGASFLLLAGGPSLCPVELGLGAGLEITPCAGIELGALRGRGEQSAALPSPQSASIFWAAAHVDLRLRWRVAETFSFEGGGELGIPLVRHSFIFEGPNEMIHEIPVAGAGATVGGVVHFR
jgi:hypothetical protein